MLQGSSDGGGLSPAVVQRIVERSVTLALKELDREHQRERNRRKLRRRVAAYLAEHPEASANSVFRELGGNRGFVLEAVRASRTPQGGSDGPSAVSDPGERETPVLAAEYHGDGDGGRTE